MTHPHHITDAADAHAFIFGGKARFTLVSKKTGKRYTYRVAQAKDSTTRFFVSQLIGSDNTSDYAYIGFVDTAGTVSRMLAGKKGDAERGAFKGLRWLLDKIENNNPLAMPEDVEFWHEGRCARCARVLTDPASIERGLGPECATKESM